MVTCHDCGMQLKSGLALMSHRGSLPCQLAKTKRDMNERGWASCKARDADIVLYNAGLDYDKAPCDYIEGGMVKRQETATRQSRYFRRPGLDYAYWCEAWAAQIVDMVGVQAGFRSDAIAAVAGSENKIKALQAALALGADTPRDQEETLCAFAQREDTHDDD